MRELVNSTGWLRYQERLIERRSKLILELVELQNHWNPVYKFFEGLRLSAFINAIEGSVVIAEEDVAANPELEQDLTRYGLGKKVGQYDYAFRLGED